jgi:ribose-phosphate pyrophosphokinase
MKLIAGSASQSLTEKISTTVNLPIVKTQIKRFPDGELYIRILENIKNQEIIIIQTTYPDENIIELFLLLDAVKRAEAQKITVIIPYFGYARQDKQFKKGEPISAAALARLISTLADNIITVDPHKEHILDFFTIPAKSVSAVNPIASYLIDKQIDLVLAPDHGALARAKQAANQLQCEVDYLEKTRLDGSTISIAPKKLAANGKTVAIIDDIISTGGTMAEAIKQLHSQDVKKIYVACTHGLFAGSAIKKLQEAGCEEIIATDTIQTQFSTVSVTSAIEEILS